MERQCAWCTRMQISDLEWSEPLGRKVHRFHRRPVTHGVCPECEPGVLSELNLIDSSRVLIAD